jgi:hypothetical protein
MDIRKASQYPLVRASYTNTGLSALVTNAINFTPPTVTGLYRISGFINIRTAAAVNMLATVTYQDGAGVVRNDSMQLHAENTTTVVVNMNNTNARFQDSYMFQIDNSGTAITFSTAGTTMTLYDLAATLEQLA